MTSDSAFPVGWFRFPSQLTKAAGRNLALRRAPLALRVLGELADAAATTGHCYRSIRRMAKDLGSDPNAVRRALKLLARLGYVRMQMRPGRKVYDFYLPLGPDPQAGQGARLTTPPPPSGDTSRPAATSGGASPLTVTSGGASPPATSGGASQPPLRGAPDTPEPLEPDLEPGSKEPDHLDPGPRSAQKKRRRAPEPPAGASLEELVRHAAEHGKAAGQVVIRRMAERLGVDPVSDGGLIGKYLWPVAEGKVSPDRLCKAARWAEKALDPRNQAKHRPLDGFLLIASGQDDVPYPYVLGSEASGAVGSTGSRRPARSGGEGRPAPLLEGTTKPELTRAAPGAFSPSLCVLDLGVPKWHHLLADWEEDGPVHLDHLRPASMLGFGQPEPPSTAPSGSPAAISTSPPPPSEAGPPPKSYEEMRAELDRDPERRRAWWKEKFGLEAPPPGRPRPDPDPGPGEPSDGREPPT